MVAHSKHHKPARQKNHHLPRKGHLSRPQNTAELPVLRPTVKEEEPPSEDEEPKPEDLAKEEEALKAEEAEAQQQQQLLPAGEESAEHRARERSSYDGDTAIKLYLREI